MTQRELEMMEGLLRRPRMHSSDIETLRDLLMFLGGVGCGMHPPHGAADLDRFGSFVNDHFDKPRCSPWKGTLLDTFGDVPVGEACEEIAALFSEWREQERHRPETMTVETAS